jgi:hypothetical protein
MQCTNQFKTFVERLQLTDKQTSRIESAARTVTTKLAAHFEIKESKIFLQGSFPNRTCVRPAPSRGGKYDVDLVVEGPFEALAPNEALNKLRKALRDTGFGDRIVTDHSGSKPCIRLEYAAESETVGFHVDVVPARPYAYLFSAPLEIPKPADRVWKATAPVEYTAWAKKQGADYIRTVQILKRWRDEHQSAQAAIKSILLQVLIAHQTDTSVTSDGGRVAATLRGISNELALSPYSAPRIENPVLSTENLAAAWSDDQYKRFRMLVADAAALAEKARDAETTSESTKLWAKLLGNDFPVVEATKRAIVPPPPAIDPRRAQEAPRNQWA